MKINPAHPLNALVLRQLKSETPVIAAPESVPDPYYGLGSHPDCVGRVWQDLNAALPVDCRAIVYGTPALVEPKSGVVIALAYGTSYALRVSEGKLNEALTAGGTTERRWSSGGSTDAETQFGVGWLFGGWTKEERGWLREVVEELQKDALRSSASRR
jgi:hypothetical protein